MPCLTCIDGICSSRCLNKPHGEIGMTPEQIKQANSMIQHIEALEELLTAMGSIDTDRIKIERRNSNDLYVSGKMLGRLRSRFEDAINAERLELLKELATKYGVRTAA